MGSDTNKREVSVKQLDLKFFKPLALQLKSRVRHFWFIQLDISLSGRYR